MSMDEEKTELLKSQKEAASQEEKKWNEIIAAESDEYGENLVSSFAELEKVVKLMTENFQRGTSGIDPAALDGLWKIFLGTRKATVDAYEVKNSNPQLFREKITNAAMKTIDGLFHADSFSDRGSSFWHSLQPPKFFIEGGLEDDYGIKTYIPNTGQSPDLTREFIASGNGEKITKVLQPGFLDVSSGKVIREAIIETAG